MGHCDQWSDGDSAANTCGDGDRCRPDGCDHPRSGQVPKPDPDLFLAAAGRLGADIEATSLVGDSVWDMLAARRARALGIGLLSGGYGREELERAGAYRVYEDPADLLKHIDEVGVRQ